MRAKSMLFMVHLRSVGLKGFFVRHPARALRVYITPPFYVIGTEKRRGRADSTTSEESWLHPPAGGFSLPPSEVSFGFIFSSSSSRPHILQFNNLNYLTESIGGI